MKPIFLTLLMSVAILGSAQDISKAPSQHVSAVKVIQFGDFMYWKFSSPSLTYARNGVGLTNTTPPTTIQNVSQGTSFLPDYTYDPGFKLGCSVKFGPQTAFDLTAVYIRLDSNPSGSVSSSASPLTPVNWLNSATLATNTYHKANLKLDTNFNWIDFQSGYTFNVNQYLALRPFIALAAIIADGKLHAQYTFTTPTSIYELADTRGHCSSWSIGPKMGLDFIVHATKHFGIFTNLNITHQATHQTITAKETISQPANGTSYIIQNGKIVQNQSVALFNLELGPTWDQWFSGNKYRLQLRTTWQTATLVAGANLSFLNNNNVNIGMGSEFRGVNIRATLEY